MLKGAGFRIRYVNFGRSNYKIPRLRNYDGLVVLGGPMNVDETDEYPYLVPETESIREFIDMDAPVLGICLGSQLIAKALGARVRKNPEKEIGWYDVSTTEEGRKDRLVGAFGATEKSFSGTGSLLTFRRVPCTWLPPPRVRTRRFGTGTRCTGSSSTLR